MMKFSASAFVLLICTAALLSTTEGRPPRMRCKCIQIYQHTETYVKEILESLEVFIAGPHCKNEEIIATTKKGKMCLNPTEDWVISLKKNHKLKRKSPKSQQ